jgi:hypothetical protein
MNGAADEVAVTGMFSKTEYPSFRLRFEAGITRTQVRNFST